MEYQARLDEGDIMFSNEVVVMDRVGVRFSEEGVGSEGGRRTGQRPLVIINSRELIIFKSRRRV